MSPDDKIEMDRLRSQILGLTACIVDLYAIVVRLNTIMPTVGPDAEAGRLLSDLEKRIQVLFARLDGSDGK